MEQRPQLAPPTRSRINHARVHRLTFTIVDEDGQQRSAVVRSHRTEFFDDAVARCVLHDPAHRATDVVDLMPGRPRFADGQWAPAGAVQLAGVLLLPAFALVAIYAARAIRF